MAVAASVLALDILVPPLVLSVARARVDYFTFNPWLPSLPGYLRAGPGSLGERLDRAFNLALFWFSADGIFGVAWGFAVTAADLVRFLVMAILVGAYLRSGATGATGPDAPAGASRRPGRAACWEPPAAARPGRRGCTVMGCGAPVIPVVGLAFVGLTSTTLAWLAHASTIATAAVIAGMTLGILYLAWRGRG